MIGLRAGNRLQPQPQVVPVLAPLVYLHVLPVRYRITRSPYKPRLVFSTVHRPVIPLTLLGMGKSVMDAVCCECAGDGIGMGHAVGGQLVDMDQVQVHPTGLVNPKDPDADTKVGLAFVALQHISRAHRSHEERPVDIVHIVVCLYVSEYFTCFAQGGTCHVLTVANLASLPPPQQSVWCSVC